MKSNKIVVVLGGESTTGGGLAVSYARNINTMYLNSHLYNEFVVRPQFELGTAETMWVTFTPKGATKPLKTLLMAARKKTEDVEQIVDGTSSTTEKTSYDGWEYFLKLPDAITLWQGVWQFSFTIAELPYVVKNKGTVDTTSDLPASGNAIGDTYYVSELDKYYVWSGTAWGELTVTAVSTSDVGEFTVNASVSAPLGAPADLDIQIMYTQVLNFLQHTEEYLPKVGENGNWWLYTADGYTDSGKRAYGTQVFKTRTTLNDAGLTSNILLANIVTNGKTLEVGDLLYGAMWDGTTNEGRTGLARITAVTTTAVTANAEGYITGKTGAKGDKGDTGAAGVGIASITSEQIATGTKIIITLTDGTQSEFLVSADSFGTITAIDFPYGEPTLTYDTTDGMHIHGVFRMTAGGSQYDIPFDQEIPLVYGDGLNADVAADGKTVLVKVADNVFRKSGGTITGSVTIGGDLTVQGTTSFVDSTHLRVSDKLIIVAKDNTVKLTSPAGLLAPRYDGTHSGALVFDGDGTAYVGDVVLNGNNEINVAKSDLQPLATRGTLVNGNLVQWDEVALTLKDSGKKTSDFYTQEDVNGIIATSGQLTYNEAYAAGNVPTVGTVLTLQTDKFNRDDFVVGNTFQMLETVNDKILYWTVLEVLTKNDTEKLCTAKITAVLGSISDEPYHIALTGSSGTITQEQFDALKADENSYILATPVDSDTTSKYVRSMTTEGATGTTTALTYTYINGANLYRISICANLSWVAKVYPAELMQNKKTSITGTGTDTEYPSTSAVVKYVASAEPYHIELTGSSGTITQEQYDALMADKRSYIILHNTSNTVTKVLKLAEINPTNNSFRMRFSETRANYEEILGYTLFINSHLSWTSFYQSAQILSYKITKIGSTSTDSQYPSGKAAYTYGQTVLTEAKSYTDTAIANAITTALNTPV